MRGRIRERRPLNPERGDTCQGSFPAGLLGVPATILGLVLDEGLSLLGEGKDRVLAL